MTPEHKTSHKCQFVEIEIYASSESWIDNISIDIWFVMICDIWKGAKNLNIEKILFKGVQMKFLAMHINNKKLSLSNVLNIFMEHEYPNNFCIQKINNFDPCNALLAIDTNIPQRLNTGLVLHMCLINTITT